MKETEDVQNILTRLESEIYLNVNSQTTSLKRQYARAKASLVIAKDQFDILNDMKDKAMGD